MKSLALLVAIPALLSAAAHANVYNRVSVSGRIVSATAPVVKETSTSMSSSSKLVASSITAASILDILVAEKDIPTKTGYTILEFIDDEGISLGFYAFNSKTADTVAIDSDLFAGLTDSKFVTATTTSSRQTPQGVVQTYGTVNTGTGTAKVFGTVTSVYFTSTTALRKKDVKINGVTVPKTFLAVNYTGILRGVTAAGGLIDGKILSNGSTYLPPANP